MKRARIVTVLGTRPEIIKLSPLLPLLDRTRAHALVHTGQHYDPALDGRMFRDLSLRAPALNLRVGSLPPAEQVGKMVTGLGRAFARLRPDCVIVQGDTNSTLAGALAAAKHGAFLVHLEAGCRSGRADSPEEQNRILVDHISALHFAPDQAARRHLAREGIRDSVRVVGSTALEAVTRARELLRGRSPYRLPCDSPFALATLHRAENTQARAVLARALAQLGRAAERMPVVFPVHPRTRAALRAFRLELPPGVQALPPLAYLDFVSVLARAECVLTDSGGLQEEAALLGTPCLVLREESEWMSYVRQRRNFLVGDSARNLAGALAAVPRARALARRSPVKVPAVAAAVVRALKAEGLF